MLASYDSLEGFGAKTKDNYSDLRKNIVTDLLGNNIGEKATQNLSPAMQAEVRQLDSQAKQRLKKDLAAINNQYIKLGQYGSLQHMAEAERRQREINRSSLEARNKILKQALQTQAYGEQGRQGNR